MTALRAASAALSAGWDTGAFLALWDAFIQASVSYVASIGVRQ